VETQETLSLLAQRQLEADKVKAGTKFIKGDGRLMNGFIQPGTVKAEGSFRDFIVRILQSSNHVRVTNNLLERHGREQSQGNCSRY
jgi:hypothetical protein